MEANQDVVSVFRLSYFHFCVCSKCSKWSPDWSVLEHNRTEIISKLFQLNQSVDAICFLIVHFQLLTIDIWLTIDVSTDQNPAACFVSADVIAFMKCKI